MTKSSRRIGPCALLTLAFSSLASAQVHCESLGPQSVHLYPNGMDDDGSVLVGDHYPGGSTFVPARWTTAGGGELLAMPPGTTLGSAVDVSRDGAVTAGYSFTSGSPGKAVLWDQAGAFVVLDGLVSGSSSHLSAISGDGQVAVGASTNANGRTRATRWVGLNGAEDLGMLGGRRSFAKDVNSDGTLIVGQARGTGNNWHAFRWTPTLGMVDLGFPGTFPDAYVISRDGSTIIGSGQVGGSPKLIRWTAATGPTVIASGVTDGSIFTSVAVSADGSAVTWGDDEFDIQFRGHFFWSAATGVVAFEPNVRVGWMSSDGTLVAGHRRFGSTYEPIVWSPTTGLRVLDAPGNAYVHAVSLDGTRMLGATQTAQGAHWLQWRDSGEIGTRYCGPTVPNSTGEPATLTATGTNILPFGPFELEASMLPANVFGFFLSSRVQGDVFPVNQSQGRLCLGGAIGRFTGPGQVLGSGGSGQMQFAVPTGAIATPTGPAAGQPGETWNFQLWFRDANPTATSNFTNGVSVTLR